MKSMRQLYYLLIAASIVCLTITSCSGAPDNPGGVVTVVSDLPMTGSSLIQTQTIVNAISMAFESNNHKVCGGKWTINYRSYDDASAALGKWDPEVTDRNAREYVANTNFVAVIGTFNSDAAAIMIPIINPEQLVMISPANTWPGLTKAGKGEKDEPEKYYPNGIRNYARVIPTDDLQGSAAAQWTKDLGAHSVFILDDQEFYGKGIAEIYQRSAANLGLKILGREGIHRTATDYKTLANKIKEANPDLVYFGGNSQNNAGQLVKDIRRIGYKGLIMVPNGMADDAFIKSAEEAAEGVYVIFSGIPPEKLTGKAGQWREDYKVKFKTEPQPFALYGYVSAQLIMDSFERVCKAGKLLTDRKAVREAVFATKDFESIVGKFSIDANGDTSISTMSGSQVRKGKIEFVTLLGQ